MKTIANILLGIILTISSVSLFANNPTVFNTRNEASWPVPPAVQTTDNWLNTNFWVSGARPHIPGENMNNDIVNIGNNTTQPHHYILRIGNIGNDDGNKFTINVFPNSTLEVRGRIDVKNDFHINVHQGGTSIITGNVEFDNNGQLTINGEAIIMGNITGQNNGRLDGTGVLFVYGTISGITNLSTTNVILHQSTNIVTTTAPVLTGRALSNNSVRLTWDYNESIAVPGWTLESYNVFKNGSIIATIPASADNVFIDTNLQPGDRPVYAVRAVFRQNPVGYSHFSNTVSFQHSALPIELLSFSATAGEDAVALAWSTAVEINNNYFTIERSRDGSNWEIITYVQGAGNANRVINYLWNDENPIEGISYYRLKQTDFDGQYEYFAPVAVEFRTNVAKTEILHVNSFGQQLDIVLSNPAGAAHLLVSDLQGRLIYRGMVDGLEHVQQVSLNLPQSFPGNIIVIRLAGQQNSDEKKIRVN